MMMLEMLACTIDSIVYTICVHLNNECVVTDFSIYKALSKGFQNFVIMKMNFGTYNFTNNLECAYYGYIIE